MTTETPGGASAAATPLTRSRGFWLLVAFAVMVGVVLAFVSLAFLGVTKVGSKWFTLPDDPGWFDGNPWWIAVTGAAGLLVGLLRRAFRLPAKLPGTVKEIRDAEVDPTTAPGAVVVSTVSLIGGASLGPEAALGIAGGAVGTWVSRRRQLREDTRATNTLTGMSAAYGGLLAAPYVATMLLFELARPKRDRAEPTLVSGLVASSISFAVFFPIAGATFLGIYSLPSSPYADWQLLAAVPLGLVGAALALITVVAIGGMTKVATRLAHRPVLLSTVGGVTFGIVGVALPLTLFTGSSQLDTIISDGAALGAGILIAIVFAKIFVFAVCEATGFIGGPFFPMLFVGGTAGVAVHQLVPSVPLALAFTTLFAAVPAAVVPAPFSLILLTALTTQIGTLQTAPVAIAVLTAYLAISGSGTIVALVRRRARRTQATTAGPAPGEPA